MTPREGGRVSGPQLKHLAFGIIDEGRDGLKLNHQPIRAAGG